MHTTSMHATLIEALCLVKMLTVKTKVMACAVLAYSYSLFLWSASMPMPNDTDHSCHISVELI